VPARRALRSVAALTLAPLGIGSLGLAGCAGAPGSPLVPPHAAGLSDSRPASDRKGQIGDPAFVVRRDAEVRVEQSGPHDGGGRTTAWRYFDDVRNAALEFRKRALHPGAAIGLHPLTHDEVYYVLSGRGELTVNGETVAVGPQTAVFMRLGASVGLRQVGDEDLVIIISYPPPARAP
jgi:mannose-6-phosphate isomerase-like protein (cupin superfamily)